MYTLYIYTLYIYTVHIIVVQDLPSYSYFCYSAVCNQSMTAGPFDAPARSAQNRNGWHDEMLLYPTYVLRSFLTFSDLNNDADFFFTIWMFLGIGCPIPPHSCVTCSTIGHILGYPPFWDTLQHTHILGYGPGMVKHAVAMAYQLIQ